MKRKKAKLARNSGFTRLLRREKLSYKEAQAILIVAEHDSFPSEMSLDPIFDFEFLNQLDGPYIDSELNANLANWLATNRELNMRIIVDRILEASPVSKINILDVQCLPSSSPRYDVSVGVA